MTQLKREDIIKKIIKNVDKISVDELISKVLKKFKSSAKDPKKAMRGYLRELDGKTFIFSDNKTIVPIHKVMEDVQYCITVDEEEAKEKGLSCLNFFVPREKHILYDSEGNLLDCKVKKIKDKTSIFSSEIPFYDLQDWFKTKNIRKGSHILITVVDWNKRIYSLESMEKSSIKDVAKNDKIFADKLYGMLEAAQREFIHVFKDIPKVYSFLKENNCLPCSHWSYLIKNDGRMTSDGYNITYADSTSIGLIDLSRENPEEIYNIDPQQKNKIFCFKICPKHNENIWRRLEIRGKSTLLKLNYKLIDIFEHENDHMSGFWKLIPRGKGKKKREVEITTIDPFGEGEAVDVALAALELKEGSELKYIYDFGDWFEYVLLLEKILEPKKSVKYPRVTEKNKPKYKYCPICKESKKKEIANYICIECSSREGKAIIFCENCIDEHDGCYIDKILY